ncbi:Trafficking protein particle complex subunit 9 [Araneus ventricosus]|uniref:Trafficking protein particle complex subunit 9 n=1 Tax=Araneus ventricosus TaxID=182803 RepID=A0A4Y1ZYG6_ARAVE|nr:Trafficking protein particle complex subunit 9 [Araneus ventricosus]
MVSYDAPVTGYVQPVTLPCRHTLTIILTNFDLKHSRAVSVSTHETLPYGQDHPLSDVATSTACDKFSKKSFSKIFERIKSVQYVTIRESGSTRFIWFRYETDYPPENNDWGDFQTHRKVLGLISIGKSGPDENVEELSKEHSILLEKYNNSMFDSRCFAFNTDSVSPSDISDSKFSLDDKTVSPDCTHSPVIDNLKNDVFKDNVEPVPKSHMANDDDINLFNNYYSSSPKSDTPETSLRDLDESGFLPDFNSLPSFHSTNLNDVNHSIDSTESNALSSSCSPSSPVIAGDSPASKKFMIPSSNSRSTHCIIYSDTNNCDQLEHDVRELVNSIFWILESKRLDRSFEKQDKIPLLTAPFEKKNFVGIDTDTKVYKKRCLGRMKKHIGDLALQAGLSLEALPLYISSTEYLKSGQDWLWLAAAYEGQCAASAILQSEAKDIPLKEHSPERFKIPVPKIMKSTSQSKSLPPYLDPVEYKNLGKNILSFEEIAEKYEEAIMHYEKYQGAAIVELECSMKAARVFIGYQKYIEASKVLQNVVFTSVIQSDEQKVIRFNALFQVFTDMGFHRKASFFKRMAAKACVANPNPNWLKCYYLMLESLPGFSLPLDAEEYPSDNSLGWPGIQYQLLNDISRVSLMLNYQAVTVRHLTYTLHTQLNRLTPTQLRIICRQLEELTAKCEGAPVPLILENGITIPPVNLLNLPRVKSFKLQSLRPHLRPVKITINDSKADSEQDSIFIFSAISRDRSAKGSGMIDFKWVEGDICEVALQVFNPLPFELKVTNMSILADDIPFESFPACLSLPAESGPYPVTLHGSPVGSGKLQILADKLTELTTIEKALESRFGDSHLTQFYRTELKTRRQKPGESLQVLAADVERLMSIAYTECPLDVWESLEVQFFINAIRDEETQLSTRLMDFMDLKSALAYSMKFESVKTVSKISLHARSIETENVTWKERADKFESLLKALEKLVNSLVAEQNALR